MSNIVENLILFGPAHIFSSDFFIKGWDNVIRHPLFSLGLFISFALIGFFASNFFAERCQQEVVNSKGVLLFSVIFALMLFIPFLFIAPADLGAINGWALSGYLALFFIVVTLFVMGVQDYRTMTLPLPGQALLSLLSFVTIFCWSMGDWSSIFKVLLTAFEIFVGLVLFYLVAALLFRREAFGQGDIILLVALSPLMPSPAFLFPLVFVAAPLGALVAVSCLKFCPTEGLNQKHASSSRPGVRGIEVPFGPFLIVGFAWTFSAVFSMISHAS